MTLNIALIFCLVIRKNDSLILVMGNQELMAI